MQNILIELYLTADYRKTQPLIRISSLSDAHDFVVDQTDITISCYLELIQEDQIMISFLNKDDHDDNSITIKKLQIDGIDQQHYILQGVYRPRYNQSWAAAQDPPPPEFYRPGTEMRHNGTWTYPVSLPIWRHVMDAWTKDDRPYNT